MQHSTLKHVIVNMNKIGSIVHQLQSPRSEQVQVIPRKYKTKNGTFTTLSVILQMTICVQMTYQMMHALKKARHRQHE